MFTGDTMRGTVSDVRAYYERITAYYADQTGARGLTVHGRLAERLGYKDGEQVAADDLQKMLEGKDRAGEYIISEREQKNGHRSAGYNISLATTKGVSIKIELENDETLRDIHRAAVLDAMSELEKSAATVQRNENQEREQHITGNMIWMMCEDRKNREGEPHYHYQIAVANLTDHGGEIRALDRNAWIKSHHARMFTAYYRAKFWTAAHAAGYRSHLRADGTRELDSVSDEVIDLFSTRRRAIVRAKAAGMSNRDAWDTTRKKKDEHAHTTAADDRARWTATAGDRLTRADMRERTALERAEAERDYITDTRRTDTTRTETTDPERRAVLEIVRAVERATEQETYASDYAVIAEAITEHYNSTGEAWTIDDARAAVDRAADAGYIDRQTHAKSGRALFTNWNIYEVEAEARAYRTKERTAFTVTTERARELIKKYGGRASDEQRGALEKILTGKGAVRTQQGHSGSGKSATAGPLEKIYNTLGFQVVGAAVAAAAAENLEKESGIDSRSLAATLHSRAEKRAPRVIVLDEASMVSSVDMHRLTQYAETYGDLIVSVGDVHQIDPIESGRMFARWVDDARADGTLAETRENWRQTEASGLRDPINLYRERTPEARRRALEILDAQKRIRVSGDRDAQLTALCGLYDAAGGVQLIAGTRANRDEINDRVRARLVESKHVDKATEQTIRTTHRHGREEYHEQIALAVGDRVRCTQNKKAGDFYIKNGYRATVRTIDSDAVTLDFADGTQKKIYLDNYDYLDYDYAQTVFSAQGRTADRCYAYLPSDSPAFCDAKNFYVALTRARHDFAVYTDDKEKFFNLATQEAERVDTFDFPEVTREHAAERQAALMRTLKIDTPTLFDDEREKNRATLTQDTPEEWEVSADYWLDQGGEGITRTR